MLSQFQAVLTGRAQRTITAWPTMVPVYWSFMKMCINLISHADRLWDCVCQMCKITHHCPFSMFALTNTTKWGISTGEVGTFSTHVVIHNDCDKFIFFYISPVLHIYLFNRIDCEKWVLWNETVEPREDVHLRRYLSPPSLPSSPREKTGPQCILGCARPPRIHLVLPSNPGN